MALSHLTFWARTWRAVCHQRRMSLYNLRPARILSPSVQCIAGTAGIAAPTAPVSTVAPAALSGCDLSQFESLGVHSLILPRLEAAQISDPAPIQAAAIPKILAGQSCALQSYTGSGKTLAFMLPALTLALKGIDPSAGDGAKALSRQSVKVVVVAPSQELAMQIVRVAQSLLPPTLSPLVQQCIGGANGLRQRKALQQKRAAVIVGTPGRLAELMRNGTLHARTCQLLVLDEVDQLLAPTFLQDMVYIAENAGRFYTGEGGRQTVLVSATLTEALLPRISGWSPQAPQFIGLQAPGHATSPATSASPAGQAAEAPTAAGPPAWGWGPKGWDGAVTAAATRRGPQGQGSAGGVEGKELVPSLPPGLSHAMVVSPSQHKVDTLRKCLAATGAAQALVFVNFPQRAKDAAFRLQARGVEASYLHGDMTKQQRQRELEGLRKGRVRVLVVSDVLARGMDVSGVQLVANLELPSSAAHYAHRAGRTGRMGQPGTVLSLVAPRERYVLEKLTGQLHVPLLEVHPRGGEMRVGPAPRRERAAKASASSSAAGSKAGAAAASKDEQDDFDYDDDDDEEEEEDIKSELRSGSAAAAGSSSRRVQAADTRGQGGRAGEEEEDPGTRRAKAVEESSPQSKNGVPAGRAQSSGRFGQELAAGGALSKNADNEVDDDDDFDDDDVSEAELDEVLETATSALRQIRRRGGADLQRKLQETVSAKRAQHRQQAAANVPGKGKAAAVGGGTAGGSQGSEKRGPGIAGVHRQQQLREEVFAELKEIEDEQTQKRRALRWRQRTPAR